MWPSKHVKQRAEVSIVAGVLGKRWISLKNKYSKKVSLCEKFLCFERLSIGEVFERSHLTVWYHSLSVHHPSLHIFLALVTVEELLLFLQVTMDIAMLNTLKGVRPTRSTDIGQPGHLCSLFMDLSLNRVPWKASHFSYVCRMNIPFTGRHMKSSSAFWGTCIQTAVKIDGLSDNKTLPENHRVTRAEEGWRGL